VHQIKSVALADRLSSSREYLVVQCKPPAIAGMPSTQTTPRLIPRVDAGNSGPGIGVACRRQSSIAG